MQYLAVLGRQSKLSIAELESLFDNVKVISSELATFEADQEPSIARLGGTIKLAKKLDVAPEEYLKNLESHRITLGISDYSRNANARRSGQLGLKFKGKLKKCGKSVRILANKDATLSSATVFHNQLGEKDGHVEMITYGRDWYVGLAVQNIKSYVNRDQARPARDAKVGMLPPKLAQILINLCGDLPKGSRLLDPFCGTGVVLQEASLIGYVPYGTDLSDRMIEYTERNLKWLGDKVPAGAKAEQGDATAHNWSAPIDAVACETYLGPPMSTPPVDIKLKTVKADCKTIITGFLKNLSGQLESGTPVVIAVPAWLRDDGSYSRLNLLDEIERLGYNVQKYQNLGQKDLLYYRSGQIVAREIIVLRKV